MFGWIEILINVIFRSKFRSNFLLNGILYWINRIKALWKSGLLLVLNLKCILMFSQIWLIFIKYVILHRTTESDFFHSLDVCRLCWLFPQSHTLLLVTGGHNYRNNIVLLFIKAESVTLAPTTQRWPIGVDRDSNIYLRILCKVSQSFN